MKQSKKKENPQNPSRLRGRGAEVSKTLFYALKMILHLKIMPYKCTQNNNDMCKN